MGEWIILGWVALVTALMLNGTSGWVAALLHRWSGRLGRGTQILLAALAAGALPASFLIVVPLADAGARELSINLILGFALVLVVGTAVSLPAAIVVTRKRTRPGEDYRAFE